MDAQLIETCDRKRTKHLFWQMIGFALFFGIMILLMAVNLPRIPLIISLFLEGFGIGLFLSATVKSYRLQIKIKNDKALDRALNNEMYRHYGYRALMWSFYVTLVVAGILAVTTSWTNAITANIACLLIIYASCLSLQVARLLYLRKY